MSSFKGSQPTETQPTDTQPSVTCSGLLSWDEIIKYGLIIDSSSKQPIHDKDPKKVPEGTQKPSGSFDLSVGDRHFLFQSNGDWKAVFLGDSDALAKANAKAADDSFKLELSENGQKKLVIPPFCSAIIQLDETVDLYSVAKEKNLMIAGRFDLKLSAIYKGLISQQATQVEPCYRGKLYCFVHNLGQKEICLEKGKKVATIEFSYVGQNIDTKERETIIENTINYNTSEKKYGTGIRFSAFVTEGKKKLYTGIEDIRWLKEVGKLPDECGIAPIYSLVTGKINDQVDTYLEKSSTIESITDRVSYRIKEKENLLRIVLTLVLAIITFFTTNLATEVRAELRYFSEELTFFSGKYASLIAIDESKGTLTKSGEGEGRDYFDRSNLDTPTITTTPIGDDAPDSSVTPQSAIVSTSTYDSSNADELNSLEAIKAHTQELSQVRTTFFITMVVALVVIVVLVILLFFMAFRPSGDQKMIRKRRELEAAYDYINSKKRILRDDTVELKRCCIFKEGLKSKDSKSKDSN